MPGSIVFRPLDLKLNQKIDSLPDPEHAHFKFTVGGHSAEPLASQPKWNDSVTINTPNENSVNFKFQNNGFLGLGKVFGEGKVDLEIVMENGRLVYWFDIINKEDIVGQVLLDIEYYPPL